MKKLIFIVLTVFLFSCTKENVPKSDNLVTVTFTSNLITGGSMTKSSENEFEELLAANLPEKFPILLTSNRTRNIFITDIGKSITIPEDEYTISPCVYDTDSKKYVKAPGFNPLFPCKFSSYISCFNPDPSHLAYYNDNCISDTPVFTFEHFIKKITNDDNEINVNIKYNCAAIFYLKDEIKQLKCSCDIGTNGNISDYTNINGAKSSDKYKLVYVFSGWCGQGSPQFPNKFGLGIKIIPKNYDIFEETVVSLAYGKEDTDKNNIEKGKYYVLHPNKVTTTNGSITGGFEDMTSGGEL